MRFTAPRTLTGLDRTVRSILIVALLLGSLFPAVGGVGVVAIAAVLSAPIVLYEVLRFIPKFHPTPIFVVALVGVLASHALFIAPSNAYGDEKFTKLITITLLSALVASLLRDRAAVVTFCRVWILTALLLAVMALSGYSGGRAEVFESNPIWLGRALATAAVMVLWLWWSKQNKRVTMLLCFAVIMGGLVATGSRGPLVGFLIAAVILTLLGPGRKVRRVVTIVALGGAGMIVLETLPIFANNRLSLALNGADLGNEAREGLVRVTLNVISRHPRGVGFGNWEWYAFTPGRHHWPHNMFLEVFAELGMIIGAIFVAIVIFVYVRLIRRAGASQTATIVLALLAAETFNVCVSGDLNGRTFFFLLALGQLAGTGHIDATMPARKPEIRSRQLTV